MLLNTQLMLAFMPKIAQAVGGSSLIFAPALGIFGFAVLLLAAAWLINYTNPSNYARPAPSTLFWDSRANHHHHHYSSTNLHTHSSYPAHERGIHHHHTEAPYIQQVHGHR
jgi:ABC-type nickel/cobalt efflux system permease component RcnA